MKFGPVKVGDAQGTVLAHSIATAQGRLRKGKVVTADDVAALTAAGLEEVTVARLDPDDVPENEAAGRLAIALCGSGLEVREAFTGRANLHGTQSGVLQVDPATIAAVNSVDPMITVATLPMWQRLTTGTMAATIKIISYAVPEASLKTACDVARQAQMRAMTPVMDRADLIVTTLDGSPTGADAVVARLDRLGVSCTIHVVPHAEAELATALAECEAPLRLILTASATSDVLDVGPAALGRAGGQLSRFGMPVDPGNLLFLGDVAGATVIGLPGCARSPALNGADWVLERVICGVPVTSEDIAAMGVGGLLKEIPTRPQPRERKPASRSGPKGA